MDSALQAELAAQVDTARWEWLKEQNERGTLILVDGMLELAVVGERLAADDKPQLEQWLVSRLVAKPTAEQQQRWQEQPEKLFRMLVITPFVLIQSVE